VVLIPLKLVISYVNIYGVLPDKDLYYNQTLTIRAVCLLQLIYLILQLYSKSKVQLKLNLRDILPVNCKFICDCAVLKWTKLKLVLMKNDFKCKK